MRVSIHRYSFKAKLIQLKDVKINNGDYQRQSLIDRIARSIVYSHLLAAYQKYAENTKTVIFCVDIQHSQDTAAAYQAAGITAEHLDGVSILKSERRFWSDFAAVRLLRKSGLLFNAEVPTIIVEEDRVAIVEIRDSDQIEVKVGGV